MENKEILKLNLHDKVVIKDRYTGQEEEEILTIYKGYGTNTYFYKTENFEFSIYSAGRILIHHKSLDEDKNIDYDFKIIEAKRPVSVIENNEIKVIDVTFWRNGKYIDLIDLSEYGEYLQFVKEDFYQRKYEDLVYLLSRSNKQIALNDRNKVQTLVLDLSNLNPDIKQDIYKLIVKEMK